MKKVALVSVILEDPKNSQKEFNKVVSEFMHLVKGRMGLPFEDLEIAVIGITVMGDMDEINNFTGKLGNINNVNVKTAISKKEF